MLSRRSGSQSKQRHPKIDLLEDGREANTQKSQAAQPVRQVKPQCEHTV